MTKTQMRRRGNAGVTLIEMLVVVTIIALFATLVAPGMFKQGDKAKAVAARVQINNFDQALTQYKLNTGLFPTTEQGLAALKSAYPEHLTSVRRLVMDQIDDADKTRTARVLEAVATSVDESAMRHRT